MRHLLALAILMVSSAAQAEPPANTIMKVTPPANPAQQCAVRRQAEEADIARIEEALKLSPQQTTLFDTWKTARVDLGRAWPCPPPQTGLDVPAPERMEHQIAVMTMSLDALKKEQPMVRALYDALDPAQRKIFDGPKRALPPPPAPPGAPPPH